ncbi:hypothetical protein JXE04_00155 [Patescibacteria group bacterium]|nr:hypothetical protein [Patescibacteria group bacterium]
MLTFIKESFLYKVFQSKYCWFTFLLSLIFISVIIPKKFFYGYYNIIGVLFIIVSSLLITCFIRNIKERVVLAKKQKTSLLGMIFLVIGLAAMSTCSVGAPICGASIAGGIVAILFPGFMFSFLSEYSLLIILFSFLIQIVALYYMNCFKRVKLNCN